MEVELGRQLYVLGSNGEVFMYHALLPRWPSLGVDSESRPHVVICLHNRLVIVLRCEPVPIPNLQHEGHRNIRKQDLIRPRIGHDRWLR